MPDLHPIDELANLRDFLARLEDGRLRLGKNHVNVTKAEIGVVKREIAFLEKILARLEGSGDVTKPPKRPKDFNQAAKLVVDIATGQVSEVVSKQPSPASEFARSGGLKGGKARAAALTPKRRQEIARLAAEKRWGPKK